MTSLAISPAGKLLVGEEDGEPAHPAAKHIAAAFDAGGGAGLWHLATVEINADLPASLAFARTLGTLFLTRLRAEPEESRAQAEVQTPTEELAAALDRAPPMRGGERLTLDVLTDAWRAMQQHVAATPAFLRGLGAP